MHCQCQAQSQISLGVANFLCKMQQDCCHCGCILKTRNEWICRNFDFIFYIFHEYIQKSPIKKSTTSPIISKPFRQRGIVINRLIGGMFYVRSSFRRLAVAQYNNYYKFSLKMKRTMEEAQIGQKEPEQRDSDGEYEEEGQTYALQIWSHFDQEGGAGEIEPGKKRVNMPKKSKYRTRAHVNPMGDLNIPTPLNPDYIDWSLHYPAFFGIQDNRKDQLYANTYKYPITYLKSEEETKQLDHGKVPTIVDIGCGYGGLMFELSKEFPDKMILGMEIRDQQIFDLVANFVAQKVNTLRINSGYKECLNIGVVKTNTMKTIHNYFRKDSVRIGLVAQPF